MLYMGMTIERKNIYLTGILFILMNFIGEKKKKCMEKTVNFLLD
jgi:hypothetical protein